MTVTRSVKAEATDQRTGMTLDELAAFIQEAMRSGVPGNTVLNARVTMRGGIKRLETR